LAVKSLLAILASGRRQFRYFFDNSLSRRGAFLLWMLAALLVAAAVIALIAAILRAIPALNVEIEAGSSAFENFWLTLGKMLSLGTAGTVADRMMAIIYWFVGLTVMGSIFAFRAAALTRTMERLKAAPSPILASGHTLILGWSPRIFTILNELAIANENVRRPTVVIFAAVDRAVMDAEIATRAPELGKLRVITRKGDPANPTDLVRANVAGAKSVIVLDTDRSGDATVIASLLAARSLATNPETHFVAEVDDASVAESLEAASDGKIIAVLGQEVIAKITAQASRQPGIPAVILELLDFAGDEIYFASVPAVYGKTFFETQLSFRNACVIGVAKADGTAVLNPAHDYKLAEGDRVMAIAEDDDRIIFTGYEGAVTRPKKLRATRTKPRARNLLLIGWSKMGERVLSELSGFLPNGSSVDVVARSAYLDDGVEIQRSYGTLKVQHIEATGKFAQLKALASKKRYDEVLLLGYRSEKISEAEADGQTLLASMQLAQLFEQVAPGEDHPRLVAEILDPLRAGLAKTASVDDLVVSENLAALLIAQLSENPKLALIFKDLFSPTRGSAVHVRPIDEYVQLGKPISFAELVAAASSHDETAIGVRVLGEPNGQREVRLNPSKDQAFKPVAGDGLVVIGKPAS
jgi:ion channel POLLUX/CASTOR